MWHIGLARTWLGLMADALGDHIFMAHLFTKNIFLVLSLQVLFLDFGIKFVLCDRGDVALGRSLAL